MEPLELDIRLGAPCIVEPQGVGERFRTVFLGWKPGRFCLVEPPKDPATLEQMYADKPLIVRYLDCKGVLCGFRSQVQTMTQRPHKLLFLDYPMAVETLSVRKHDRVDCFLPAVITAHEVEIHGHIVNISTGGFRFSKREETGDRGLKDLEEKRIQCRFSVIDEPVQEFDVQGEVKSVSFQDGKLVLKAGFVRLGEKVHQVLESFVAKVSDHLDGSCSLEEIS